MAGSPGRVRAWAGGSVPAGQGPGRGRIEVRRAPHALVRADHGVGAHAPHPDPLRPARGGLVASPASERSRLRIHDSLRRGAGRRSAETWPRLLGPACLLAYSDSVACTRSPERALLGEVDVGCVRRHVGARLGWRGPVRAGPKGAPRGGGFVGAGPKGGGHMWRRPRLRWAARAWEVGRAYPGARPQGVRSSVPRRPRGCRRRPGPPPRTPAAPARSPRSRPAAPRRRPRTPVLRARTGHLG